MLGQDGSIEVVVADSREDEEPLYQTTARRQESAAIGLVPHEVRFAINNPGDPIAEQSLVVSNVVVTLTVPDLAIGCLIQVQTAPIRWTAAGTQPAAATGFHADALSTILLQGRPAMKQWQAIREGAADGAVFVEYFD
jgi:hypothetical protein